MKNYTQLLKDLLAQGKLNQKQLAEKIGVTYAALSRWLNGHAVPHPGRVETIKKLHRQIVGYASIQAADIEALIHNANQFKRRNLRSLIQNHAGIREALLLEHTYHSTVIEGNTMTKKETEAVLFAHKMIPDKSLIEHLEMVNHAAVLRKILTAEYHGPIDERFIKQLHMELMQGIREDAGHYSKMHRVIRSVDIQLTHPEDIPEEMGDLIRSWKKVKQITLKEIADFHVQFELVHPFGDGNGRVGRLIMAEQCLEAGYVPLVIENDRKLQYYEVLEYAQKHSDGPLLNFLVDELKKTESIFRKYKI